MMMAGRGDELPVSAMPADGTYPSGTTQWEKRNISDTVPAWEPDICIQCGNCAMVCPHSVIRARYYDESALASAPQGFASAPLAGRGFPNLRFTLQVAVEDCTGCELCVEACPARSLEAAGVRAINMAAEGAAARARAAEPGVLRHAARQQPGRPRRVARARHAVPDAAVRVLGRVRGLRRNAVPAAAHPAVRRSAARGERHGLLVHLRRQPPDDAVVQERGGPRPRMGQLAVRGQRRVRPRLPALARQASRAGRGAAEGARAAARIRAGHGDPRGAAADTRRRRRAAPPGGGARRGARPDGRSARRAAADAVRSPGAQERLDRRRRRVGVRHRLRRARSRARVGPQRAHPRARHRGVLEHRRPGLEVHAARRRREVRRRRQAAAARRTSG